MEKCYRGRLTQLPCFLKSSQQGSAHALLARNCRSSLNVTHALSSGTGVWWPVEWQAAFQCFICQESAPNKETDRAHGSWTKDLSVLSIRTLVLSRCKSRGVRNEWCPWQGEGREEGGSTCWHQFLCNSVLSGKNIKWFPVWVTDGGNFYLCSCWWSHVVWRLGIRLHTKPRTNILCGCIMNSKFPTGQRCLALIRSYQEASGPQDWEKSLETKWRGNLWAFVALPFWSLSSWRLLCGNRVWRLIGRIWTPG